MVWQWFWLEYNYRAIANLCTFSDLYAGRSEVPGPRAPLRFLVFVSPPPPAPPGAQPPPLTDTSTLLAPAIILTLWGLAALIIAGELGLAIYRQFKVSSR